MRAVKPRVQHKTPQNHFNQDIHSQLKRIASFAMFKHHASRIDRMQQLYHVRSYTSRQLCCRNALSTTMNGLTMCLQSVADLPAADAIYHRQCYLNFRTGEDMPSNHATDDEAPVRKRMQGRSQSEETEAAFGVAAMLMPVNPFFQQILQGN